MLNIAFRPYAGDDGEEKIESDHVERALLAALPGQISIVEDFPADATHAFGRPPKHWARLATMCKRCSQATALSGAGV